MKRICSIGFLAGLAALLVAPTLAQPPATNPPSVSASANPKPAGSNATVPSGSLQKVRNDWRGRTLIGTVVFNDNGQRIASINDLLITDDGRVDQVILSVGRIRGKLVAVPFNQLRFAPSGNFLPTGWSLPTVRPRHFPRLRAIRKSTAPCCRVRRGTRSPRWRRSVFLPSDSLRSECRLSLPVT